MERSTAPLKAAERLLDELRAGDADKESRSNANAEDDETIVYQNWTASDPLLTFEQGAGAVSGPESGSVQNQPSLTSHLSSETPDVRTMNQIEQKLDLVERFGRSWFVRICDSLRRLAQESSPAALVKWMSSAVTAA
ncbi:MAG: hypothetical protein U0936_12410 [Planctomycetaceae bacterium]